MAAHAGSIEGGSEMTQSKSLPLFAVLFTVFSGGCEESTTEPAEPLSMQETEALYLGMQQLAGDSTPDIISATPDGAVVACPGGGQITRADEVTEAMAADTARLLTRVTLDPEGCVLSSGGYEFTVDGNPDVQLEVNITIVGSTFEFLFDGSLTGGLDWQLDDRSGTCMIDLTLGVMLADPPAASFSGTMCEHEVEFDATVVEVPGGGG